LTKGVVREALVHFDLYRHLMNIISSEIEFDGVKYKVEPEVPVSGKSADLVIYAYEKDFFRPLLVIEVKKQTKEGFLVFDDEAVEQARFYAKNLQARYFAITDGKRLRFFETPKKYIGDYQFSLDESACRQLLEALALFKKGEISRLPFPSISPPTQELIKRSDRLVKELVKLFEKLSSEMVIQKEWVGSVMYANVKGHRGIIRLGLDKQVNKAFIDVRLKELKKALGSNFIQMIMNFLKFLALASLNMIYICKKQTYGYLSRK